MTGTSVGAVWVDVLPSAAKFAPAMSREMAKVNGAADRAGSAAGDKFSSSFTSKIKTLGKTAALGLGGAFAGIAGFGIKTAAEFEQTQISLETLMGSSRKAKKEMKWLTEQSAATPFELADLAKADKTLLGFGFSSDKVRKQFLLNMGDMAAAVGLPSSRVPDLARVFGQINASGRASLEDINQLIDAGIPVWDALEKQTGKSVKSIRKDISDGKLSADEFFKAMNTQADGKFAGAMEKQSQTLAGLWSSLKDNAAIAAMNMVKPFTPLIKDLMPKLSELAEKAGKKVAEFAKWIKNDAVPALKEMYDRVEPIAREILPVLVTALTKVKDAVVGTVKWFNEHRGAAIALAAVIGSLVAITKIHAAVMAVQAAGGLLKMLKATKLVSAVTKTYTAVQWALNAAMTANPIGLVIAALVALVAGVVIAYKKSETFRKIVDGALRAVGDAAKWLGARFSDLWDGIKDAWDGIKDVTRTAILWVVDKFLWWAEKIVGAADFAFGWIPGLGGKLEKAKNAVANFRKGVNAEMDRINDEEVVINLRAQQVASFRSSDPDVRRAARAAAVGGAGRIPMDAFGGSGRGLITRVNAPLDKVRSFATDASNDVEEIAEALAQQIKSQLPRVSGPSAATAVGRPGRALPGGSYRIGMPYLGYPGHYGADYPAATGTPVFSPWAGRVVASYDLPGSNPYNSTPYRSYGRLVRVAHGNGTESLFAHLHRRMVAAGQSIRAGQQVGQVGMNGNATGPHLHYEFRRAGRTINPASLGIFDVGGVLDGRGGVAVNLSGKPERVLDPRTTDNFERLTNALDRRGRGRTSDRVALTITNWDTGEGYMETIAERVVDDALEYEDQMKRMR